MTKEHKNESFCSVLNGGGGCLRCGNCYLCLNLCWMGLNWDKALWCDDSATRYSALDIWEVV